MITGNILFTLLTATLSAFIFFELPVNLYRQLHHVAKQYINLQGGRIPLAVDLNQLELIEASPRSCTQHSDCVLKACYEANNCRLIVINADYASLYLQQFAKNFNCPQPSDQVDNCFLYNRPAYAACEDSFCVIKTMNLPL
jgi:hypothetical protein